MDKKHTYRQTLLTINRLSQIEIVLFFSVRFSITKLGKLHRNCNWHIFVVSVLLVLNSFIKNLFITKSKEFIIRLF